MRGGSFFDLASGLNKEIRSVRDYLNSRNASTGRFSLSGVKGVDSPELFANLIRLASDIAPIDLRVQPDSMERVIQLLGGEAIYRSDRLAPVRELIQNARDAIALRHAMETANEETIIDGRIDITSDLSKSPAELLIHDNGIGMTKSVVKNHLITVASDFWHSADFARDFEQARSQGFRQIGRFGIGFLSVFMLGDEIEVDTERAGSTHIRLKLRGLGRRGELRETASTGHVGTRIKIKLNPTATDRLVNLPEIARARAPMLPYTITTSVKRANDVQKTTIDPGWWRLALAKDIRSFVEKWHATATEGSFIEDRENVRRRNFYRPFSFKEGGWTGTLPEAKSDLGRLISMGTDSPEPILVCSNGIAVRVRSHLDLTGLVDAGDMAMFPDRGSADEFGHVSPNDPEAISIFALTDSVRPKVRNSISELASSGMMPSRYPFLRISLILRPLTWWSGS
jgi:hypothetical protein